MSRVCVYVSLCVSPQLLAEVILAHRVVFKLLRPLQGSQALQQQDPNGSLSAAEGWVQLQQLHQLAQTSSPVLRRALEVNTPRDSQGCAHSQQLVRCIA
jgi:hypothetical protein